MPSANSIAVATLVGYKLLWHKVSKDHSGKCDVVQTDNPKDKVVGVVHEILNSEKASLDSAEGLGNGYAEKQVALETESGKIQAQIYYATSFDPSELPYTWYKALVVAGAKEHGLLEAYISALETTAAKIDADALITEKDFAIANAG